MRANIKIIVKVAISWQAEKGVPTYNIEQLVGTFLGANDVYLQRNNGCTYVHQARIELWCSRSAISMSHKSILLLPK